MSRSHLVALALVAVSLGACGGERARQPVAFEGPVSASEQEAWNELAEQLARRGSDVAIRVRVEGRDVHVEPGGQTYERASPRALSRAMVAVAMHVQGSEGELKGEDLPRAESFLDEDFRRESWDKLAPGSDASAALLREGAAQAAVLAFLFQSQQGAFPARRLAARSLALEAMARALSGPDAEDPLLLALQVVALGRPDEALSLLDTAVSVPARSLAALLRTDVEALKSEESAMGVTFRILSRRRDARRLGGDELHLLDRIAPEAIILRQLIAAHCDVSLGHDLSQRVILLATGRARRILSSGADPAYEDVDEALQGFARDRRAAETGIDPLLRDLAEGLVQLALHVRCDFLMNRYGHEPSAHAFAEDIARALGDDHPVAAYSLLRIKRPTQDEAAAYARAVAALPDRSRAEAAVAYLHAHARERARELYERLEDEIDDEDVVPLKRLASVAHDPFRHRNKRTQFATRALVVDPYDPQLYFWASDAAFEKGIELLPHSYAMIREKASRIANRTFTYERDAEEAIRYLESARAMVSDDSDLVWTLGRWQIALGRHEEGIANWRLWIDHHADRGVTRANAFGQLGPVLFEAGRKDEALAALEEAARSYAATPLRSYAAVLEASGRVREAEKVYRALVERYPGITWVWLAAFYDRIGRPREAELLYRAQAPRAATVDERRELFRRILYLRPERIAWLYREKLLPRSNPYDDGNFAIALALTRKAKEALRVLEEGESAGRMNPSTIWFHYVLLIKERGLPAARAYLERSRWRLTTPAYQRDILAALDGTVDPEEILERQAGTSYNGTYQSTLCPVIAFTWKAEGRNGAEAWMERSARSTFETFYLPLLARAELGIPPGDWWRVASPRAAIREASGLPLYY